MENFGIIDYMEAVIKRKWFIVGVTSASILISLAISKYTVKPNYEAKHWTGITPVELKTQIEINQRCNIYKYK